VKRANRKNKTVLSLSGTILLCVVIVAACFALLFINTEHVSKNSTAPQPAVSVMKTPQPQTGGPLPVQPAGEQNTEDQPVRNEEKSLPEQKPVQQKTEGDVHVSAVPSGTQIREGKIHKEPVCSEAKKTENIEAVRMQEKKNIPSAAKSSVKHDKTVEESSNPLPAIPPAVNNARLVFVFDDAGQNMSQLEKYVTLPFPVTIAVLPKLSYSKACAERIRKSGNEVMLHQPMQAVNMNVNPGPGAVTPDMQPAQITALVRQNISEIGPVAGVNNHEGSLISEDEAKIGAVMQAAKECNIFFLDSRTTSRTQVPRVSIALGIPYYERNVFLDNSRDRREIIREIIRGLDIANANGAVIMIGHVWSADVLPAVLIEMYPALKNKGYNFTTVSKSGAIIKS